MNWTIFGAVGEVVGAAGVVASLVYVARQVGFSARQSQLHNRHQASAVILAAIDHIAADDDIASIYARGTRGFHNLTEVQQIRFSALFYRIFSGLEEAFQAERANQYPDWSGSDFRRTLAELVAQKGVREWWAVRKSVFSDEFAQFVDRQWLT